MAGRTTVGALCEGVGAFGPTPSRERHPSPSQEGVSRGDTTANDLFEPIEGAISALKDVRTKINAIADSMAQPGHERASEGYGCAALARATVREALAHLEELQGVGLAQCARLVEADR